MQPRTEARIAIAAAQRLFVPHQTHVQRLQRPAQLIFQLSQKLLLEPPEAGCHLESGLDVLVLFQDQVLDFLDLGHLHFPVDFATHVAGQFFGEQTHLGSPREACAVFQPFGELAAVETAIVAFIRQHLECFMVDAVFGRFFVADIDEQPVAARRRCLEETGIVPELILLVVGPGLVLDAQHAIAEDQVDIQPALSIGLLFQHHADQLVRVYPGGAWSQAFYEVAQKQIALGVGTARIEQQGQIPRECHLVVAQVLDEMEAGGELVGIAPLCFLNGGRANPDGVEQFAGLLHLHLAHTRASSIFTSASGRRSWPEIRRGSKVSRSPASELALARFISIDALSGLASSSNLWKTDAGGMKQRSCGMLRTFNASRIVPTSVFVAISAHIHSDCSSSIKYVG